MTLRLYNTLTRSLEIFTPIDPGFVRMYVCGMTIYDLCHMGHARMMMAFDVVYRWLSASGFQVTYVRNITDIEDKIIRDPTQIAEAIKKFLPVLQSATAGRPGEIAPPGLGAITGALQ